MYVPAVLDTGVIAPVEELMLKPAGEEEKLPPVYTPVPVKLTG